jgi:hypothetical protein
VDDIRKIYNFFIAGYIVLRAFFYDWYTALFLTDRAIALRATFLLATIFIVLGIWAKKKPITALLIALVLSCLLYFADMMHDPSDFFKERSIVMSKTLPIVFLGLSLLAAKTANTALQK